jgi:L-2-hydroxycarboxylate dehydrogenase (NAD+)
MMIEPATYGVDDLIDFATRVLVRVGVPVPDAEVTSLCLVGADQQGTASHGLLRLSLYVSAIESGGINRLPNMQWITDTGSSSLLDADGALGQVAMARAVDYAMTHTNAGGVSAVAVQNSSHYGTGAFWVDQLSAAGFIAFLTSTTGPTVAPFGADGKMFGTNPLTIGAPSSGGHALTADMATSTGAYGKVIAAKNEGTPLPEGWAMDAAGRPTTDPVAAMAGALTPFGGHKGSAVSALLEAIAASLGTASFAHETEDMWNNPGSRMNTGHLLITIDSNAFTGRAHTEARVETFQERIRASSRAGGEVLAPGDPEHARAQTNRQAMSLSRSTSEMLDQLAQRLDVPPAQRQ